MVGRRDAKDVRPLGRVDQPLAALERDRERDVRVARANCHEASTPVALVDDRNRAVGDRLADVAGRGARGQARVVALDPEAVLDAVHVGGDLRGGQRSAVGDRLTDVRRPRERGVDGDRHGLDLVRGRLLPPQPARTAQSPRTSTSCLTKASVVPGRPSSLRRRRRPAQVCLTRSDGLPREPSPRRRRAGRSGGCARSRAARGRWSRSSCRSTARRSSSAADPPAAGSSRSRTRGSVARAEASMSRRCSWAVSSDAGRSGSCRPTSSSEPSAFCSASRSSARALGVRNTVRNGEGRARGEDPHRRARSGARSARGRRPSPAGCRRLPGARAHAGARPARWPLTADGSFLGDELADERLERRRLPAAVRPNQRVHSSGRDLEVDVVEGDEAAEALREAARPQRLGRLDGEAAHAQAGSVSERASAESALRHQPRAAGSSPAPPRPRTSSIP